MFFVLQNACLGKQSLKQNFHIFLKFFKNDFKQIIKKKKLNSI